VRQPIQVLAACLGLIVLTAACSHNNDRSVPQQAARRATLVATPLDHLDVSAREPMLIEHPDGTLFVSGYGAGHSTLWKSRDHGATWARVDVGAAANGAIGNSDVDLAVARDGTLYFVAMVFDNKKGEGVSISVGVSKDVGATWSWTLLSKTRFDDRPWVAVAPDGIVHVIWNDGSGVGHAVGTDGGRTWKASPKIHPKGGSSHMAVGPKGEVAVRVTPLSASGNTYDKGVDLIAVSTDAGARWQTYPAPGQREWSPWVDTSVTPPRVIEREVPRWVEPLAWDADSNLYSFWTNKEGLWLGRSADRGATWTTSRVAESRDVAFYPYLIARGHGELAASWFSGHADTLYSHVARIDAGAAAAPLRLIESTPVQLDVWQSGDKPTDPPARDSAGEYLALAFLHDGRLAMVSPIQNMATKRFGFTFWTVEMR
jgi:hypothetical protein